MSKLNPEAEFKHFANEFSVSNYQQMSRNVENIGLDCKICEEECTNIKQIQEHEEEQHDIAPECNV